MAIYSPSEVVKSTFYPYVYTAGTSDGMNFGIGHIDDPADDVENYRASGLTFAPIKGCSGYFHTIMMDEDNILWGAGLNSSNQTGIIYDGRQRVKFFERVHDITDVFDFSCGSYLTHVVKTDGTLWGIGYYTSGAMGAGDASGTKSVWTRIGAASDWVSVYGGSNTAFAINSSGELFATGSNTFGKLGLGDEVTRNSFTQVGSDTDWEKVIGSMYCTYAIKNGTLYSTGYQSNGELGLGEAAGYKTDEFESTGITTVSDISAGERFVMIVKNNGTLWGCGKNDQYQCGFGSINNVLSFTQVGSDTDWALVDCTNAASHIIKTDGKLYVCGDGSKYELGNGSTIDIQAPTLLKLTKLCSTTYKMYSNIFATISFVFIA